MLEESGPQPVTRREADAIFREAMTADAIGGTSAAMMGRRGACRRAQSGLVGERLAELIPTQEKGCPGGVNLTTSARGSLSSRRPLRCPMTRLFLTGNTLLSPPTRRVAQRRGNYAVSLAFSLAGLTTPIRGLSTS